MRPEDIKIGANYVCQGFRVKVMGIAHAYKNLGPEVIVETISPPEDEYDPYDERRSPGYRWIVTPKDIKSTRPKCGCLKYL